MPYDLTTRGHRPFAFIRFYEEGAANAALALNGSESNTEKPLEVTLAKQDSFFTKDTGFITNDSLHQVVAAPVEFDSSMPASHYEAKYRARPLDFSKLFTLRVDNLADTTS